MMRSISKSIRRNFSAYRVAIIGSGPSAFYSAKYLIENKELKDSLHVDIIEKLPVPYGLVRFGVAPDHPEVKTVMDTFNQVAGNERVKFIGNVELGKDVSVQQLQNAYSAVLVATGSSSDRTLIVPGEDAKGVMSACSFVNWYNGHPDFVSVGNSFDLSNVTDVVVVGNGNVAIDCARILTADVSTLEPTDITEAALKQLRKSSVKRVSVLARRGHGQSAFTIKELRELTKLSNVKVVLKKTEIEAGLTPETLQECKQSRPRKRLVDLIESLLPNESSCTEDPCRDINLRFLVSPVSVNVENNAACGVEVEVNQLVADPDGKSQACMVTDEPHEVIPGQLVIRSIGYKSEPIPELPFDSKRSVIPNDGGRVISESGECLPGLYVSGWVKRGPTGIIGSNIMDAKETTGAIVKDIHEGKLKSFLDQDATSEKKAQEGSGNMYFKQLYDHLNVVDWEAAERIHGEEERRGSASVVSKPREKITNVAEMLGIAEK